MRSISFFTICLLMTFTINAQTEAEVMVRDLKMPLGIEQDLEDNFWIAESGTGRNNAAVTVIWNNGKRERVIQGLPSSINYETGEVEGAIRAQVLDQKYLAVFTGKGDHDLSGSILIYNLADFKPGKRAMSAEDASIVIQTREFARYMGFEDSNPCAMVYDGRDMFIADASMNAIIRRKGLTGQLEICTELPSINNPFEETAASVEAVPTKIVANPAGGFLVSTFTGFPHPEGAAKLFAVSTDGIVTVEDSNLTMITDVAPAPDGNGWLVLEFGQFFPGEAGGLVPNSARIIQLYNDGSRELVASGFGPSAGMVVTKDGGIYATEMTKGTLIKIVPATGNME